MQMIDRLFNDDLTLCVLGMQDELAELGLDYISKRIRRLLRKMGIEPIYPKKILSRLGKASYIHPYALRGLPIVRANKGWVIDISFIPLQKGFLYLSGIIDVY